MPKNYWMVVQSRENFEISRKMGFEMHGLGRRYRRRAQRMEPDDRVLFYVSGLRKWAAAASIKSPYFEDQSPVWKSHNGGERFPYRVKLSPYLILDEEDYIDGLVLGPRLDYVKRWPPETWQLAFMDALHLLPQKDFRLIESEMKKILRGRTGRRRRPSRGGAEPDRSRRAHPEESAAGGAAVEEGAAQAEAIRVP